MAKIYLDRLKKKYPEGTVRSGSYRQLIEKIMAENSIKLDRSLFKITDAHYTKQNKKITKTEKRFVLPSMDEIVPRRTISVKKAAEQGSLITDDLRDKLSTRLKDILKGKGIERRAGAMAGTLKNEVLAEFEKEIKKTFVNYTKKDPKFGVPPNIRNIATTELRGAVNQIKHEYNQTILQKNPDTRMTKTWIHNTRLLKNPKNLRESHLANHKVTIAYGEMFTIDDEEGVYSTPYPHHSSLPAGQVIGCQCEIQYKIKRK